MGVDAIRTLLHSYFANCASQWMLRPETLRIEYVPSPGGFGTMNFTVHDGVSSYHVKLNESPNELSAWTRVSAVLTEKYRAPRMLEQLEIGGRCVAVLERPPGETPGHPLIWACSAAS